MCTYCHEHGEGKKWYLQAQHYSEDLLADLRRREYIQDFFARPERMKRNQAFLKALNILPSFVQRSIKGGISARQKKVHLGQVIPLEEVEKILSFVTSIVRINCFCRQTTVPVKERDTQRYCYGLSMGDNGGELGRIIQSIDRSYLQGPHPEGLEVLSKEEALSSLREHASEHMCHTVWTFHTPFIGGICNCDLTHCHAMQATLTHNTQILLAGEYKIQLREDLCSGCQSCLWACPFGALQAGEGGKVHLQEHGCWGCGTCRQVCVPGALELMEWKNPETPVFP